MLWLLWITAGIALLIAEIFTTGFLVALFGIACLIAGAVAHEGGGWQEQIAAFCVSALLLFFIIRPLTLRYLSRHSSRRASNIEALIGREGRVVDAASADAPGRVMVESEEWRCSPAAAYELPAGRRVRVVRVEGNRLVVEPAD